MNVREIENVCSACAGTGLVPTMMHGESDWHDEPCYHTPTDIASGLQSLSFYLGQFFTCQYCKPWDNKNPIAHLCAGHEAEYDHIMDEIAHLIALAAKTGGDKSVYIEPQHRVWGKDEKIQ